MAKENSTSEPNVYQRLLAITSEIEAIPKLNRNEHGKFDYVSHDQITEALRPLFVKHRVQPIVSVENAVVLESGHLEMSISLMLVNVDDPEDRVLSHWSHVNPPMGGKESGASLSYATKYAYSKTFLISGASPELDHENTSSSPPAKGKGKRGKITENQARFLFAKSKEAGVEPARVKVKIMMLGSSELKELPPEKFDDLLEWVKSGGKMEGEEKVTPEGAQFIVDLAKRKKLDISEAISAYGDPEDWTIHQWAEVYKKVEGA